MLGYNHIPVIYKCFKSFVTTPTLWSSYHYFFLCQCGGLFPLQAAVTLPDLHSAAIAEVLLQHGADLSCEEGMGEICSCESGSVDGGGLEEEREEEHGVAEEGRDPGRDCDGDVVPVAGDNWGSPGFTPLHLVCAMSSADTKLVSSHRLCIEKA